jgi:hypothetical protein
MKLILHTGSGLSGRLLSIISAYRLAKLSGRELEVIWNVGEVPCEFTDLFEQPEFSIYAGKIVKNFDKFNVFDAEENLSVWATSVLPNNGRYPSDGDLSDFCGVLRPKQKIMDIVDDFMSNKSNLLGVHLRRVNVHMEDNCNVPYIAYINKKIGDDPNTKIFLASDCKDTLDIFNIIYWPRIHMYTNNTFTRWKLEDMEVALINILILSRCNFILRSGNSGFSYLPCLLGRVPNLIL